MVYMLGWRRVAHGVHAASFRPGTGTIPYRLMALALGLGLMALTHLMMAPLLDPKPASAPALDTAQQAEIDRMNERLLEGLDPDTRASIEAEIAANREARAAESARVQTKAAAVHEGVRIAYTVLMVLFGLLGLLPVVSLAWNQLAFWRDAGNRLILNHWGVFPKRDTIPLDSLSGIRVEANEHVERRPTGKHSSTPVSAGWRWRVWLISKAGGMASAEFVVHHQRERPDERRPAPEPVRLFVDSLQHLTNLPVEPIAVKERNQFDPYAPRVRRGTASTTIPLDDPAALDGLPRELRAQIEAALRGEGSVPVRHVQTNTQRVTVTDQQGRTQTYDSMDDLPDEVREKLDRARASGRFPVNEQITVQDEGGKVHHYQSPEEMPPDIRALYEQMRGTGGASNAKPWE